MPRSDKDSDEGASEDDEPMETTKAAPPADFAELEMLTKLCGSESMARKVKETWDDLMAKGRLDISKQRLGNADIGLLLKVAPPRPSARLSRAHALGASHTPAPPTPLILGGQFHVGRWAHHHVRV